MADSKISALTAGTAAATDRIPVAISPFAASDNRYLTPVTLGVYLNLSVSSDGVLRLRDAAGTSFSLLQFGGTTSSFPALKRSSAALHVRLADDSNYADCVAQSFQSNDFISATGTITSSSRIGGRSGLATPAAASAVAGLTVGSALVGIYWGTGDPNTALTAPKGSLFLRTDGSGVATRAYINTDASTAWTAIATAG